MDATVTADHQPELSSVSRDDGPSVHTWTCACRPGERSGDLGSFVKLWDATTEHIFDPAKFPGFVELPPISSYVRLTGSGPQFRRIGKDDWVLLGRASDLVIGSVVEISKHGSRTKAPVKILCYTAERTVQHRKSSYTYAFEGASTRWVIAEFVHTEPLK